MEEREPLETHAAMGFEGVPVLVEEVAGEPADQAVRLLPGIAFLLLGLVFGHPVDHHHQQDVHEEEHEDYEEGHVDRPVEPLGLDDPTRTVGKGRRVRPVLPVRPNRLPEPSTRSEPL